MDARRVATRAGWLFAFGMAVASVASMVSAGAATLVVNGAFMALGLGTAVASLWRARGARSPGVWYALAAAGLSWAFRRTVAMMYQATRSQLPPIPSLADVGYIGFLVAMGVALSLFARGRYGWRDLLDAVIVALALALVGSLTELGVLFAHGFGSTQARALLLAYALGDIILVTWASILALRASTGARGPLLVLLAGLVCVALSDTQLMVLRLQGAFAAGPLVESLRFVGFALVLLLPLAWPSIRRVPPREPGWPSALLPIAIASGAAIVVTVVGPVTWTPIQTALGAPLLVAMVVRMTATNLVDLRLRRERADALERLQAAEAQRSVMLRAISHELRNPLTPVNLHAQMAAKQAPEVQASADIIRRNIGQVARLAEDLNVIAKSDTREFRLDLATVDIGQLATRAVESETPDAQARGVLLDATVHEGADAEVDAERLQQVLGNLLRNAIKFTPPGGRVHVHVERLRRTVRVEVRDSGRGLTRSEARRLFEPFVQVHDRTGQAIEDRGSGLGLYISKRLVEAHGGRIGVNSDGLGRGSTFWFEVPR